MTGIRKVIVLGAGASYGATLQKTVPCPLVNSFFEAAQRLGLLSERFAGFDLRQMEKEIANSGGEVRKAFPNWDSYADGTHLEMLLHLVEEQLGVPARKYLGASIDVERIMGLVEGELLHAHTMRRMKGTPLTTEMMLPDTLESQLHFLVAATLIKTTEEVNCPYHEALATWLSHEDAVVSFNYDLLIDRALLKRGDWNMSDGYYMRFRQIGRHKGENGSWRKAGGWKPPVIKLLKPHGSLNWLYCRDPYQTLLHRELDGVPPPPFNGILYCLEDMHSDIEQDHPLYEWWGRYEHEDGEGKSWDMHSLIVPPALTKPYRDLEPIVGHIWALALSQLAAQPIDLYFIGYSMRPGDLRSWWMFRKAAKVGSIRRVYVIDPSDEAYDRVREVFEGVPVERGPKGIAEFASGLVSSRPTRRTSSKAETKAKKKVGTRRRPRSPSEGGGTDNAVPKGGKVARKGGKRNRETSPKRRKAKKRSVRSGTDDS